MGIRFFCPNGHKLNVKEFQAGRRGICPYCGAKIQIPSRSTRGKSRPAKRPQEAAPGEAAEPAATVANELQPQPGSTVGVTPAVPVPQASSPVSDTSTAPFFAPHLGPNRFRATASGTANGVGSPGGNGSNRRTRGRAHSDDSFHTGCDILRTGG